MHRDRPTDTPRAMGEARPAAVKAIASSAPHGCCTREGRFSSGFDICVALRHRTYAHHATYPGNRMSLESITNKSMAEEEQQYRNQRSVQEQAQERAYQQWEQERERGREPRWER